MAERDKHRSQHVPSDRPGHGSSHQVPQAYLYGVTNYVDLRPASLLIELRRMDGIWLISMLEPRSKLLPAVTLNMPLTKRLEPSVLSGTALLCLWAGLAESNGSVSVNNGKVLFANLSSDGSGNWYTIAAPVQVPRTYDNYCPNYSSALLPARMVSSILEFASDYNANNVCVTYFASEAWNQLPGHSTTYTFINQQAGMCLDDYGWGSTNILCGLVGLYWIVSKMDCARSGKRLF